MMKNTLGRSILISVLLVFSSSVLTGCFEMNYPDKETYYNAFSDTVYVFKTDEEGETSFQETKALSTDFFNDESVNDVDSAEVLEPDFYEYVCIKPSAEIEVTDFAIQVKTDRDSSVAIRLYLVDELPSLSSIRAWDLPDKDEDGHEIDYSDRYKNPMHDSFLYTKADKWQSFYVNKFTIGKDETEIVKISAENYLVVQFLNNVGYGKDLDYMPVKFSPANLIISPKNEKYMGETK